MSSPPGWPPSPTSLGSGKCFRQGGASAVNVVGALDGAVGHVKTVVAAVSAVFADVRIVPVMVPDETYDAGTRRNVVVVATRDP
jgi:hypothetical protein